MSIQLQNVTKQFGEVHAVRNVSFSVKEGELMALLGPSGGGKTTVLRMIAGLELPTTGDIFIRGKRVNDLSVQQRNIGFVFQNYALFKNMNVFRNIAFGLKIKKWKRADIKARIAELLTLLEQSNISLPEDVRLAASLSDYAVAARYPGPMEPVTEEEYREAVSLAEAVLRWVDQLAQIGKEPSKPET